MLRMPRKSKLKYQKTQQKKKQRCIKGSEQALYWIGLDWIDLEESGLTTGNELFMYRQQQEEARKSLNRQTDRQTDYSHSHSHTHTHSQKVEWGSRYGRDGWELGRWVEKRAGCCSRW